MPDREKVIKEFADFVKSFSKRDDTYYKGLFNSVLAMLKEQGEEIENLKQTAQSMMEGVCLLKEQGKAKVVFGRCKDGSFATECGHCGMYLDKAYSICPKCNKELDWNSNQS